MEGILAHSGAAMHLGPKCASSVAGSAPCCSPFYSPCKSRLGPPAGQAPAVSASAQPSYSGGGKRPPFPLVQAWVASAQEREVKRERGGRGGVERLVEAVRSGVRSQCESECNAEAASVTLVKGKCFTLKGWSSPKVRGPNCQRGAEADHVLERAPPCEIQS